MENKISDIIRQATEEKIGSKIFYSSFWPREQKFEVSYNGFTNFIQNYCSCVFSTIQKKNLDYAQAQTGASSYDATSYGTSFGEEATDGRVPVMINMKFEISDLEVVTIYSPKFIYICTSLIQEAIMEHFIISNNLVELTCFLLETDIWSENGLQYSQIRFHFPYTLVDIDYMNSKFIPSIISTFSVEKVLNFLTVTPLISLKDIIIPQTNTVITHGGKLSIKHAPLCLTTILGHIEYDKIPEQDIEVTSFCIPLAGTQITPLQNSFFSRRLIDSSLIETIDNPIFWIPLILSIHFNNAITPIRQTIDRRIPSPPAITREDVGDYRWTPKGKLEYLLPMVSPTRINTRNFWYDIGKTIYNIYNGDNIGINIWENCTSDIELKDDCRESYFKFQNEYFDIRTVAAYAKDDNPEKFKAWHNDWLYNDLIASLSGDHVQAAVVVFKTLFLDYIYDPSSGTWYHFVENRLKRDLGGLEIAADLTNIIIPLYMNLRKEFNDKSATETNPGARAVHEQSIKYINMLIKKFSTSGFRDAVIKISKESFKDDYFAFFSDESLATMGWKNGVTECYDETITFRGGKIQDYITKTTRNYFPSNFDDYHPQLPFMYEYYSMLHTDSEFRYFFLKDQGSFLSGGNPEKYFRNWIGKSDASKSQYVKFLQEAFGEYCVDLPPAAITLNSRGSSGGPDPSLEQCKGARLAIVGETSISEPLDCAKIKKYTGNDRYFNRSLHKEGGSRALTIKLIHMSNVIANAPNSDEAFEGRMVCMNFGSKWIDNPPATREEQFRLRLFKKDENFHRKIRDHTQAQIYLMFKFYPIYKKEGLKSLPAVVISATLTHRRNNDPFYNFIEDKLVFVYSNVATKTLDQSTLMQTLELYSHYKRWFISTYPQIQPIDFIRFRIEMSKPDRLGDLNSFKCWVGVSIKDDMKRN